MLPEKEQRQTSFILGVVLLSLCSFINVDIYVTAEILKRSVAVEEGGQSAETIHEGKIYKLFVNFLRV